MMRHIFLVFCLLAAYGQLSAQTLVEINGEKCSRNYDGIGTLVSYGKLLYDYPQKERDEIMDYLFLPNYGANIQILKVEIGYDGNNTAMAWSSHRRTLDEPNNFDRGYAWWYMKEAKKRNKDIVLSALHWGYPAWAVTNDLKADFVVDFVEGALKEHGLFIDYIGGNQNETGVTPDITKKIREKLDKKGLSKVKIISADEGARVPKFTVIETMAKDPEYAKAVGVIGVHYKNRPPSFMPASAYEFGKPIWSSEDGGGSYVHDTHGYQWVKQLIMLLQDVKMTGVIRWLATASIYDNMPWPKNGIMATKEPWSGHYIVGSNMWAFAHFTQFIRPGWKLIECPSTYLIPDGKGGGAGRFIAYRDPASGDYSIVINGQDADKIPAQGIDIAFKIAGGLSSGRVNVWRSCFNVKDDWFIDKGSIEPDKDGVLRFHVEKDCVYTLSTTSGQGKGSAQSPEPKIFPLPYRDNFEAYAVGELPRYFVNANSTFEIAPAGGSRKGNVLRQVVSEKPILWHPDSKYVAQPVTEMGDMSWSNYTVGIDAMLENQGKIALGCRIDSKTESNEEYVMQGYWLTLDHNGDWEFYVKDKAVHDVLASGNVHYGIQRWAALKIDLQGSTITVSIDGNVVAKLKNDKFDAGNIILATLDGQAADFHTPTDNYTTAQFDNLEIIK